MYSWQVHVQTLQSLAPATVLQKLCLFNCKLDQEAAEQLMACLEDGGFANLQELDLTGNIIEAPQMEALLHTLQHRDRAPSLEVNPCHFALSQPSYTARIGKLHATVASCFALCIAGSALLQINTAEPDCMLPPPLTIHA